MREAQRFGLSHLWAVAVLVAVTLLSLTGHGALSSQAVEDPPPAASSESDDSDEKDEKEEEGVSEESDPEINFYAMQRTR